MRNTEVSSYQDVPIIEDKDGKSCNMRVDVVSEIVRKGTIPVQCKEAECMATFPNRMELDFKRFAVREPKREL